VYDLKQKEYEMFVYVVMCESWDGDRDLTEVYELYAKETDAEEFVKVAMSGKRSSYSPKYWVDEMEVKG
jgi:hypothetical protein